LPIIETLVIDQAPTNEGHVKAWLWTCLAATFTLFATRTTGAATALQELLGDKFDAAGKMPTMLKT